MSEKFKPTIEPEEEKPIEKETEEQEVSSISDLVNEVKKDLDNKESFEQKGNIVYSSKIKNELESMRNKDWQGFCQMTVLINKMFPDFKIEISNQEKEAIISQYNKLTSQMKKFIDKGLKPSTKWQDYFSFNNDIFSLFLSSHEYSNLKPYTLKELSFFDEKIRQGVLGELTDDLEKSKDDPSFLIDALKLIKMGNKVQFDVTKDEIQQALNEAGINESLNDLTKRNLEIFKENNEWISYARLCKLSGRYKNMGDEEEIKILKEAQENFKNNIDLSRSLEIFTYREEKYPELLIKNFQEFFNWLGFDYDLEKAIQKQGISLPTPEQKELAEKQGYTQTLIIPNLPRQDILDAIQSKFKEEFSTSEQASDGIYYLDQAKEDLPKTSSAQKETSPKPYQIILKPDLETQDAHPETMIRTFPKCQDILNDLNNDNPDLTFKGFNLSEYLIFQAYTYYQVKQKDPKFAIHPDERTWTWLLDETLPDNTRCLDAGWRPDDRRVCVDSPDTFSHRSFRGVRFAAIPAKLTG